ncbi:MAG TPA: hypothetical protein PL066_02995 [bacterium]|nr:hypothetical protein [bacterium]
MQISKEDQAQQQKTFEEHLNMALKTVAKWAIRRLKSDYPELSDQELKDFMFRLIFNSNPTATCKQKTEEVLKEFAEQEGR